MHEAGQRAFEVRDASAPRPESRPDSLPPEYVERLQASETAWTFFSAQAPWYQRTCGLWVMDAKREETRARRLATAIEWLAEGKKRNWKYENC